MKHLLLALLLVPFAAGQTFGEGAPGFTEYVPEGVTSAPEPTIGIPWNTDHVFYHSGSTTLRGDFSGTPTWTDVTALYQVPTNVDPMLHADPDFGRIFAGGLHGVCSAMMMSDDDGETWFPSGNMCSGPDFDHQSIGSGPGPGESIGPLAGRAVYYCAQGGTISCARSLNGGATFELWQTPTGPCGGFHGHIRVNRVSHYAALPVASCGNELGLLGTDDYGESWAYRTIPDTFQWTNGFDPSLQFTRDSGWMYYGMASEFGAHILLSKDEGMTWETIGQGMGESTHFLEVGQFHDPPIVAATFADVQAGDDDRVAYSFIGIETYDGADLDFLQSPAIFQCNERQDEIVWYYYTAFSYDAGSTWEVVKMTDDPVQVGGMYDVLSSGSGDCRNLLDFNDSDIDSQGRVYVAWGDGCTDQCAETQASGTSGYRDQAPRLSRQESGRGLFAEFDTGPAVAPVDTDGDGIPDEEDPDADGDGILDNATGDEDAPGFGVPVLVIGLLVLLRRR